MAAQCNRGVSVGLYSDLSAAEIERVARDCRAQFAMVEDEEQVDKISSIRAALPELKAVVFWRYKGLARRDRSFFIGLRDALQMGRDYESAHPDVFEQDVALGKAEDLCSIVYTSGATREAPRGALHSYGSLMANARAYFDLDHIGSHDDIACYLPPAWITEQCLAFGCHLLSGGTVNFAESPMTHQDDLREIAPTVLVYNSRLWESQAGQVQAKMRAAKGLKRLATRAFMPVGYRRADAAYRKQKPGLPWRLLDACAEGLVFRPVRDSLGLPRARVCYTSGSMLSAEAVRFFHALRVPLKNVYGSAEAGVVTGAADGIQTSGTIGSVNAGVEVVLTEQGEITVRHPGVFLGYLEGSDGAAPVADDGWARTGDQGRLERGGEGVRDLVLIDRLEDLIALPCGDIVPPQFIESRLKYSPYIKDAWVLAGPDCETLSAVVIVDPTSAGHWADQQKARYTTFADLSQTSEVYELIEREIAQINVGLPETRRIDKYVNLHKEFDADEFELTRNRKLRRVLLNERYREIVQALAGDDTTVELEARYTYQDGRTGTTKTALRIATVGQEAL